MVELALQHDIKFGKGLVTSHSFDLAVLERGCWNSWNFSLHIQFLFSSWNHEKDHKHQKSLTIRPVTRPKMSSFLLNLSSTTCYNLILYSVFSMYVFFKFIGCWIGHYHFKFRKKKTKQSEPNYFIKRRPYEFQLANSFHLSSTLKWLSVWLFLLLDCLWSQFGGCFFTWFCTSWKTDYRQISWLTLFLVLSLRKGRMTV